MGIEKLYYNTERLYYDHVMLHVHSLMRKR